jgi:uncharacterized protein (DUF305 family)
MFVFSFALQYYVMSSITTNNTDNITNSLDKFYTSTIMATAMGMAEVIMNNMMMNKITWSYYFILGGSFIFFLFLYRNQVGVTDNQWLRGMIEHHSMALFTSEEILKKTHNNKIKKLANNIIQSQVSQIKYMKSLL